MSPESAAALRAWLGNFPASAHPLDEERGRAFVIAVRRHDHGEVDSDALWAQMTEHGVGRDDADRLVGQVTWGLALLAQAEHLD
jgi:hypothetical protein